MASRDVKDLILKALQAWLKAQDLYKQKYPDRAQPFITCTYRSLKEQDKLYEQGRTQPGKIVTNAKGGKSNHNKYPSPAFDIAFKNSKGQLDWNTELFKNFSALAKSVGLSWGGDWATFKDNPHFEIDTPANAAYYNDRSRNIC
jgi:peptidoglycan L-alanyl-D-glutamate endopeptidase CwlK